MNEKLILKCNNTRDSINDTNTGKNNHLVTTSSHPMKFIDLCSGIGGFHIGLKQHTCILACDINKNCRESYKRNYNIDCKKDIFDLHANDISDFHILCAGFPCQPFSSAGLKKGLDDNRSQVYDKILELVTAKKPNLVFLENVKNLLVMDDGNVIKKIINDFKSIGYNISYTILNTAHFGLAQNRERVFIVCVNKSVYGDKTFDFSNLKQINITKSLKDVIDTNNNTYIEEDKYVLLDTDKIKTLAIKCGSPTVPMPIPLLSTPRPIPAQAQKASQHLLLNETTPDFPAIRNSTNSVCAAQTPAS